MAALVGRHWLPGTSAAKAHGGATEIRRRAGTYPGDGDQAASGDLCVPGWCSNKVRFQLRPQHWFVGQERWPQGHGGCHGQYSESGIADTRARHQRPCAVIECARDCNVL